MRVMVIPISEQTIPNFLFIKTFGPADYYFFISTDKMEDISTGNRREWIMRLAGINPNGCHLVKVNPESMQDVTESLSRFKWVDFEEIIVNLTGGTKMMSLAVYEFFKPRSKFLWYIAVGSNRYHLCDDFSVAKVVDYQMNVQEYLGCCGIFKDEKRYNAKAPLFGKEIPEFFMQQALKSNTLLEESEKIRLQFRADEAPYKNKEKVSLGDPLFAWLIDCLERINYLTLAPGKFSRHEIGFITGGWFEEYCYYAIRDTVFLNDEQISLGVTLNPYPKDQIRAGYFTNNDLDVVFVYNNTLYVVECKTAGMDDSDLFNKTVYLASALRKYFLLTVKSILCTLSTMSDEQKEKARTLGISVFSRECFENGIFQQELRKIIN